MMNFAENVPEVRAHMASTNLMLTETGAPKFVPPNSSTSMTVFTPLPADNCGIPPTQTESAFANTIFKNAFFRDWDHFETVFLAFQRRNNVKYRKTSCLVFAEFKDPELYKKYRYNYVIYACEPHAMPRFQLSRKLRANAYRTTQTCHSKIKICYRPAMDCFQIISFVDSHTHALVPLPYNTIVRGSAPKRIVRKVGSITVQRAFAPSRSAKIRGNVQRSHDCDALGLAREFNELNLQQ